MLPGLLVSLIALVVVLYLVDLEKLVEALRLAEYRFILLGAAITFLWMGLRSMAWRTLLQERATFRQVFHTINEGYLLNNALPFRLGELGRAFLLGRKAGLSFWEVFSTILIERSLDLAIAAGLLLSTLPFVIGASWARQAALTVAGVVALGLFGLYLAARNQAWVVSRFEMISRRLKILQKLGGKAVPAFLSGLAVMTNPSRFILVVVWMLLNWVFGLLQYYVFLLAFFPDADLIVAAFALGAAALGLAAPSAPGAVGVFEATLVFALSVFHLDSSTALAFAITVHLIQYLVVGVLGSYALARDGETLTGLYRQVRGLLGSRSASG